MALWLQPAAIHLSNLPLIGDMTLPRVAWTWYVLIGAIVTFAVGYLASKLLPKPRTRTGKTAVIVSALIACLSLAPLAQAQSAATHLHDRHAAAKTTSQAAASAPDFSQVSTLINDALAQKKLPGAVVVIGHDGKVVFHQAFGNRKVAGEVSPDGSTSAEPMTEDTIFDMASLTKCLATATSMMQLYEQGKYQFDDPVAKYLPEFGVNGKDKVTIRDLLTHYSGLPPDVSIKDPWGLSAPDKAEGIKRAMESKLDNPPGTKFVYSDINFITLGALVEKLSGQPLDVYAQEHIFKPLKMTDTTYHAFDKACASAQNFRRSRGN